MKERPIIFSGPMVRAILDGTKTQTRRVVKNVSPAGVGLCHWSGSGFAHLRSHGGCSCNAVTCPYGFPGDRLWVRETFQYNIGTGPPVIYRADYGDAQSVYEADRSSGAWTIAVSGWRPSIFMPRAASRILLEITDVRLQRLQDISKDDAQAEGATADKHPRDWFHAIWDTINGNGAWHDNPWVWAVTFTSRRLNPWA